MKMLAVSLVCCAAFMAVPAMAADGPSPPPPGAGLVAGGVVQNFPRPPILSAFRFLHPRVADVLVKELGLSGAQEKQVRDLIDKLDTDTKPRIEAQRTAVEEFVVTLSSKSATQSALEAAADKVTKAETDLVNENIKAFFALRALLTPEQDSLLMKYVGERTQGFRALPPPAAPAQAPRPSETK